MYIVKYSERAHMARMHELASASPPYERVPNILRYTINNLFIIYPLNGCFTIDSAPTCIYNIQDHPAFHFALVHYENTPMQYTAIFHGCNKDNFHMKNCDIFAQNIDCGYKLEPPH